MDSSDDSYENDCEFWKKALRALICTDEELTELLEQKSLYWNDDLEIITTFVLKTIKQFSEENGGPQSLLPMFKDDDDAEFAKELFRNTLIHGGEYRNYIKFHQKLGDRACRFHGYCDYDGGFERVS